MESRENILCHWDLVRFIDEEKFLAVCGASKVISVCERKRTELMIFLGKEENGENYEVRVYKAKPTDKYVPHPSDEIIRYKENDKYASFFFDSFKKAAGFIEFLSAFHAEYKVRPVRVISDKI